MRYDGCKAKTPCELDPRCGVERIVFAWDGPAVGRKAVAFPSSGAVFVERAFWDSLNTVDGRASILYHELGHLAGARCEPCADFFSGWKLRQEGAGASRDARRAMRARLDNRDPMEADRSLMAGWGYGAEGDRLPDLLAGRTRKTVEGWRDGKPFALVVVDVGDGQWLAEDTARAWLAAVAEAKAAGISVKGVSGWRDNAKQTELYSGYKAVNPATGKPPSINPKTGKAYNPADPPGYSKHQPGDAMDGEWATVEGREKFAGIAERHGLTRPVTREPWHFVYTGGGRAAPLLAGGAALALLLAAVVGLS